MIVKTAELSGATLDWAVAKCLGKEYQAKTEWDGIGNEYPPHRYSTDWLQADPIIDHEGISILRCEDDYVVDKQGFTTRKRIPVWAATRGQHDWQESYNSYGEPCGSVYELPVSAMTYGPTSLVAAMRCYVASVLGDSVEVPDELIGDR